MSAPFSTATGTDVRVRFCPSPTGTPHVGLTRAALFNWALHPKMHITISNEKIAAYAGGQMQVKGGILIGIWDEQELAAIRARIAARSSGG